MATVVPYKGIHPDVEKAGFIAPTASIIGDVQLGENSSVWYGAVLRGDVNSIRVGANTSIQDNCVLHGEAGQWPDIVGNRVTVGHGAILHGCTVEDDCLIGLGSVILNGCVIGTGSIIAAGAVIREGTHIPPRSLVAGVPGVIKREVSQEELETVIKHSWEVYIDYARQARRSLEL